MAEFINNHMRTGQTIGVINGIAYDASNVYVIRSKTNHTNVRNHYHSESPGRTYHHQGVSRPGSYNTLPPYMSSKPKTTAAPWMDYRQFKRKKRISTYKLYAYEGKVKNSFKKGIRWIKLKCRKIVHGF